MQNTLYERLGRAFGNQGSIENAQAALHEQVTASVEVDRQLQALEGIVPIPFYVDDPGDDTSDEDIAVPGTLAQIQAVKV